MKNISRDRREKKAIILWYTDHCNYGDYLIYQTVTEYLTVWGFSFISMDVGQSWTSILRIAKECNLIWFAGGGIIERGVPDVIQNFRKFHTKAKKIMYGVTGLSIGDFDYIKYRKTLSYWVHNASFFYARDSYTTEELNRLSKSQKVNHGVDVVFANQQLYRLPSHTSLKVGINIRDIPYPDLSGIFQWQEWKRAFQEVFSGHMVGIPDQHDCIKNLDISCDFNYCPEKVTDILQKISFTVSMRFHVILVAAILGKVSIPISYCPKVSRLAKQLGIEDLELAIHDYHKLKDTVHLYEANQKMYQQKVEANVKRMRRQAEEMFQAVRKILEENDDGT